MHPKPQFFGPNPKRLPERPRMTFILGLKCENGLVIAADSQEGDTYTKKHVRKLEQFHGPQWGICWGGSGAAKLVDKFSDKFRQCLEKAPRYDRNDIENIAETCLEAVHKKYSKRLGDLEIVAGCFGIASTMEWHLYKADSQTACMALQGSYCCAGTGDNSLAEFILRNIDFSFGSVRILQAEKLAVLTISLMKEYGDRIGGPIRILEFNEHVVRWLPVLPRKVSEIEKEFPIEVLEGKISSYWADRQDFRGWANEVNADEWKKRKKKRKKHKHFLMQSTSQKSEPGP
jgi:20S proteasome alpha/beta subunit